jgi:predicted secreted protein
VFVSHCLLNQNTRYPGGAAAPGVVRSAICPYVDDGTGIIQMPCPEQRVWGGVLKTRLLRVLDHPWIARLGTMLVPAVTRYLRRRYRKLARAVADDLEDYVVSGLTVTGVVGVAGSPSCGVRRTMDLAAATAAVARCPRGSLTAAVLNDAVVGPAERAGAGIFIEALTEEMARRGLSVELREQGLVTAVPAAVETGALRP